MSGQEDVPTTPPPTIARSTAPAAPSGEFRDGADWASLIEGYEDHDHQPDPSSMAAADIDRQLGILRRLYARQAAYEQLHLAEIDRLEQRRAFLIGPLVDKIQRVEAALRRYALRSFLDFGKTGTILATPNGVIRASRELLPQLDVDDEAVAKWATVYDGVVALQPKVRVGALRELLARLETAGNVRRAVRLVDGTFVLLDVGEDIRGELQPGELGVWLDSTTDPPELLPGLAWAPSGLEGCGRTFTIEAV